MKKGSLALFDLSNVTLVQENKILLKNVHLSFQLGGITAILGANGAGKSTLFRTLLGEYQATTGKVCFNQKPLHKYSQKSLSQQRAYIAQQASSMFNLLTIDYLVLARFQRQESDAYSQNLALDIAKQFNITHLLMRDMTQLSGGELQLIEYTRAYLQLYDGGNFNRKCLLLDEPASALDIKQTRILYGHLQDFCRRGGTVIIIDHNINAVSALASHLVLMKHGKILQHGSKKSVFTQSNLDICFDTQGHVLNNRTNTNKHSIYHLNENAF